MSSGFTDKLYWRERSGTWHCFTRSTGGGYVSLCERFRLSNSGGQSVDRPAAIKRCGLCDGLEMKRRGWDESGPERPDRRTNK
jgi:hypothetical protein